MGGGYIEPSCQLEGMVLGALSAKSSVRGLGSAFWSSFGDISISTPVFAVLHYFGRCTTIGAQLSIAL